MFLIDPQRNYRQWNFHYGNIFEENGSPAVSRYYHLLELAHLSDSFLVAMHDPETGSFSKWQGFYKVNFDLQKAIDVHRSILENEIVIESDYPTYEENYQATRIIGAILESKGYSPLYYYSGNKSVHIHVFLDFKAFLKIDHMLQEQILSEYKFKSAFLKAFIEYIRTLLISCWNMPSLRKFDSNLIKARHLIRCELSRNKIGYKTFLGYSYKDVSFIPSVCNEEINIKPKLGAIRLSSPNDFDVVITEFLSSVQSAKKKKKESRKMWSLENWLNPQESVPKLRQCLEFVQSDDFKTSKDGYHRAMFFLANELKEIDPNTALSLLRDWNERMGTPCLDQELTYRVERTQHYNMSCDTIHEMLNDLGFGDVARSCNRKVFKSGRIYTDTS